MPQSSAKGAVADRANFASFAVELADIAAPIAMQWFRHGLAIDLKADRSPVTEADRTVEAELRSAISARFPGHGILGEEHGRERLDAEVVWVVDPIDGTRSFITGMPLWGTLIAVVVRGSLEIGVISAPATSERWVGERNQPTTLNGSPCRTSGCRELAQARLFTTSPYYLHADERARFEALMAKAHTTRFNGDCYTYGLLASGHVDLIVECRLEPFDYCALVPVVEGAGGVISDWEGKPLGLGSDGRVIAAATPELHAEAMRAMGLAAAEAAAATSR